MSHIDGSDQPAVIAPNHADAVQMATELRLSLAKQKAQFQNRVHRDRYEIRLWDTLDYRIGLWQDEFLRLRQDEVQGE